MNKVHDKHPPEDKTKQTTNNKQKTTKLVEKPRHTEIKIVRNVLPWYFEV